MNWTEPIAANQTIGHGAQTVSGRISVPQWVALYAWSFVPVVNLTGLYVAYPNQIRVLYGLTVVALLCWATQAFHGARRELAFGLLWPIGFGIALIIVSFFGLDFNNSVRFHVLYQPLLHAIPFLTWFVIARYFPARRILQALVIAALAMALHSFVLIALGEGTGRYLSDLSVPFGLAAGAILGVLFGSTLANVVVMTILMLAVWLCLKKTVLACAVVGLMVPFLGYRGYHADRMRIGLIVGYSAVVIGSFHLLQLIGQYVEHAPISVSSIFGSGSDSSPAEHAGSEASASDVQSPPSGAAEAPQTTVDRFFEAPDPTRTSLGRLSRELLFEHFPYGIGYMSFMKESVPHISYTTFTASGEMLWGVSLHNTYMHFALEGGLVIVLIVIAAGVVYVRAIIRLLYAGAHEICVALLTWSAMIGFYGWFHQVYMTDYMFGLFGFALGAAASNRAVLAEPRR